MSMMLSIPEQIFRSALPLRGRRDPPTARRKPAADNRHCAAAK